MPHSPSARPLEPGAQQEIGVEEEVPQAALPLARVHHEAVTHQLMPLERHRDTCNAYMRTKCPAPIVCGLTTP